MANNRSGKYAQKPYIFQAFKFETVNHDRSIWPKARSGHRLIGNINDLFIYGGYNPDQTEIDPYFHFFNWNENKPLFREVWKYNIAKREWSKLPTMNTPNVLASNAVILQGSILMVYGGTGVPFGRNCSNSLYVCNLSEEYPCFREVSVTGDIPMAQYGQAIFMHQHYFYVIGGTNGFDYSCDVHCLDLHSGIWEAVYLNRGLPNEPLGRYRHELGMHLFKCKVYILGGGTAHHSYGFQEIPVFDLRLKKWSTVQTIGDMKVGKYQGYPRPRRYHSLVQAAKGNDIFITGGVSGGIISLSDSWKLNLDTLQWTRIDSMKLKNSCYFHSATLTPQGKMYLFGGLRSSTRSNELLTAWLCIPKLKEICWEAINHYNFHNILSKDSLQQLIPPEFLKRLD